MLRGLDTGVIVQYSGLMTTTTSDLLALPVRIGEASKQASPRAIGVSRVSEEGDRGERLRSFTTQHERMTLLCAERIWDLVQVHEERNVSGGNLLVNRPGLLAAVEAIEAGKASILVFAFKNRFDREPAIRDQVIDRVEAVGGIVWTADAGRQTNATAVDQFTGTVMSAADRMSKRQAGERSRAAVTAAVAEGVVPWKVQTPGLGVDKRGRLVATSSATIEVVERALALRADGASIQEVREFLAANGVKRSYHGVQGLLHDRLLIGEIHFKALKNLTAHAPFVDPAIFARAQKRFVAAGPRATSDALLARLGVLRCSGCNGGMVADSQIKGGKRYRLYRCPAKYDCPRKVTIGAPIAEEKIVAATIRARSGMTGRASAKAEAKSARAAAAAAQAHLDELIAALTASGLLAEPSAVETLTAARLDRDAKTALAGELEDVAADEEASVDDWENLTVAERRGIIKATVVATVAPGGGGARGADRVAVRHRFTGEPLG
jgi:DNA invertase Pin-like site-specific DNA recombinase